MHFHSIQRLMLSKGAKWTIFYQIKVILQYCWNKTIARSRDMYRDASGIFGLVIKRFGITNTSVQNFAIRISSVKTVSKGLRKTSLGLFYFPFLNKYNIDLSSLLMSSLRTIVICQNIAEIVWYRLKSIFLFLYLTWGVVLCVISNSYFNNVVNIWSISLWKFLLLICS